MSKLRMVILRHASTSFLQILNNKKDKKEPTSILEYQY